MKRISDSRIIFFAVFFVVLSACAGNAKKLSDAIDLRYWKLTLPMDSDGNGKVDEIGVNQLAQYFHSDYFFVDEAGRLVFQSPNRATTTANSSNTRSELRQMLRGSNDRIKTKSPENNFSLSANEDSHRFASIGGKLSATLHVNHVAKRAKYPNKYPAYSVVVGQIHAGKDAILLKEKKGFGWGNEPLKIYYKKWPGHKNGSVFWTYERNLAKNDPNRKDIAYPVWGNTWSNDTDPGDAGIALGEEFSYEVHVNGNMLNVSFETDRLSPVNYSIDLSNQKNAYGVLDEKDHPEGYSGDWMYFKAGAYNQCSTKDDEGFWYAGCLGSGNWDQDKLNGDYASVTFSKLRLSPAD